jgi:hypothetical protein
VDGVFIQQQLHYCFFSVCELRYLLRKSKVSDLSTGDATVRILYQQAIEPAIPLCGWTDFGFLLPWRCVCISLFFFNRFSLVELKRNYSLQAQRATLLPI